MAISTEGSSTTEIPGMPLIAASSYPAIASSGDATGPSTLYAINTRGTIYACAGTGSVSAPLKTTNTQVGTLPSGVTIQQLS